MTDNLIEEIKEDVRKDQLLSLWKKYGNAIIWTFIAVILAFFMYFLWNNHTSQKLLNQTLSYEKYINDKEKNVTQDLLKLIDSGSDGYKLMSIFELADISKDKQKEFLENLINDNSIDNFYKEIAVLKLAFSAIKSNNMKESLEFLQKIGKNSLLKGYGLELEAVRNLKMNNLEATSKILSELLKKNNIPYAMKIRARAVSEILN